MEYVVDVVIAVHDLTRPIRRAVASVLDGARQVRVSVVCHGIAADDVARKLEDVPSDDVRLLEFADGIRAPAGPFNFGLDQATAPYVCVMGSDDFLEPGAMSEWIREVQRTNADVVLAPLRYQNGAVLRNPLVRRGRVANLDPVRDRLYYRTSPLGLLKRSTVATLGLRFSDGLRSGMDVSFSARLWSSGVRIDLLRHAPCYVIASDAGARVSTQPMAIAESFRAMDALAESQWVRRLTEPQVGALITKLIRVHVLGAVLARPSADRWTADDLTHLSGTFGRLLALAPDALRPLARSDRDLLDAATRSATPASVAAAIARHRERGRLARLIPRNPIRVFDRESTIVRFALYRLDPERP